MLKGPLRITVLLLLCTVLLPAKMSDAQNRRPVRGKTAPQQQGGKLADYRSRNFLIHTDLPAKEAKELLVKLEKMFGLISRYWGRRNPKTIECFVVQDLKNWPAAVLQNMDPDGLAKIRAGAGVTKSSVARLGRRFSGTAKVFAMAHQEIPQHEAVHAFCAQAFGRTGPVWYAEGMAEMGKYWRDKNAAAVHCSSYVAKYLRGSKPKQLADIVDPTQRTGDSWQNYAWRWALCHLLANNTNYASRFRPLGLGLLTKQNVSFVTMYGAMAKEINFEYHFFLSHLEPGFRVDLCSWNWKAKYRPPSGSAYVASKIDARHGWQASRVKVKAGETYQFSAEGTWKLAAKGTELTADGDDSGNGRLVGIVFDDYKLGKPFELGAYGTFTASTDGQLLLRCKDKWTELADNKGSLRVKLKIHGKGKPLPRPKDKRTKPVKKP